MSAGTLAPSSVRSTVRRTAGSTVRRAAGLYDRVRPPGDGVVALAYHRVGGGTDSNVDLDTAVFDEQMAFVAGEYEVASLDSAVDRLAARSGSGRTVVVTFDDGTADFVEAALPILQRHGVSATLYLATSFVGGRFPWGAPALSWSALRDAVSTGLVAVGSHTHRHLVMDKVTVGTAREEVERSVGMIGDELGVTAEHFAYPKGVPGSPAVVDALASSFRSVAGAEVGVNPWTEPDLRCLHRTPIVRTDDERWFARKVDGGLRMEGVARRALNRFRYRTKRV